MSLAGALQRLWRGGAAGAGGANADRERWVVLDVETTGLDPAHDRLLAIAAVAVQRQGARLAIALADSFSAVIRNPDGENAVPDKANILIHGIGIGAQRRGLDAAEVLQRFNAWAAGAPRLGYHVAFDRAVIERAERAALGRVQAAVWLDLEPVAAVTQQRAAPQPLDHWLATFGITCLQRHQAAADTLATAELLLRLWPAARADGARDFAGLQRLVAHRRWLNAPGGR